jgi:hypothetical protein
MRSYSTPQSALDGEITKLAIAECVAAVALYVGIGVYFGTFRYLALAVVFAPLMLFRTEFSAEWGFTVYKRYVDFIDRQPGDWDLIGLVLAPMGGTAIRIGATLYWAIRRPLQTLKDVPQNWMRQSFCTDFAHPPEIVPLEILKGGENNIVTFARVLEALREWEREGEGVVVQIAAGLLFAFFLLPFVLIGWLPSLIYRVSFKATALVYTPFIWVAHATLRNPLSVKARLERITKGELEKVRRGLSWIILATLVAKVALVFSWVDRGYIESKFPSQKFVASFVILDGWPWWQITLGADALLTFLLFFFADAALARLDGQQAWREATVLQTVSTVSFLRAAFSLVTISHFFHIALVSVAPQSMLRLITF